VVSWSDSRRDRTFLQRRHCVTMYVVATSIPTPVLNFSIDPFIVISALFVQLITLPIGMFLAWVLPKYRFSAFGYSFSLNPGPFNVKEHTLISIMINVVLNGLSVTDIASAMRIIYGIRLSIPKQYLLGIVFQLFGFCFAGMLRRILVWPPSMIWPGVLVRCALLNTMHSNYGKADGKRMSRERFLYIACLCSFVWYWVPGYLWTGLSIFNWVCWIAPNNIVVNNMFGSLSGLGMGLISFDWAQISLVGSPLVVPVCSVISQVRHPTLIIERQ
jgi:hypothetical protein